MNRVPWIPWAILIACMLTWGIVQAQKPPPKKEVTEKTWLAPKGKACPIFRYGPDTTLQEAAANCSDYCAKTKACLRCEKRSGEAYPTCK